MIRCIVRPCMVIGYHISILLHLKSLITGTMFDKSMHFSSSKRQTVKYVMYKITIARFLNAVSSVYDFRSRDGKFESQLGLITFMEIDHEMISAVTPHPNLH